MQEKVVGMVSSYPGLNQCDWLWQQTPHPFGRWGTIQMLANAPNPDFLLFYQFDFPRPQSPSLLKQFLGRKWPESEVTAQFRNVPQDRRIYLIREPPLPEVVHITQANYKQAKRYCRYVSGPDDLAPVPDYMPAIWYHSNAFRELDEMPSPSKVRLCSWITSGINRSANHSRRLAFIKQLQAENLAFDLYGRNLPPWANSKGILNNKWSAMAPYYYNLAIENFAENDWYVSEKLWDALLAWCLPIYYGGSAATKLLPEGSFLRLPSLDEAGVQFIKEVTATPDYWFAAQPAIAEARKIILHELNLLNWLSNFITNF